MGLFHALYVVEVLNAKMEGSVLSKTPPFLAIAPTIQLGSTAKVSCISLSFLQFSLIAPFTQYVPRIPIRVLIQPLAVLHALFFLLRLRTPSPLMIASVFLEPNPSMEPAEVLELLTLP